jgi:hypothetical protein
VKNPALPECGQAISAVKALAIAQQEGQKIYTITPQNASTALAKLSTGGSVGQEIRSTVLSGKEVTVHEKSISAYGWSGYGYVIVDPETGAGGYIIEGSGNGGFILAYVVKMAGLISTTYLKFIKYSAIVISGIGALAAAVTILVSCFLELDNSQVLYMNSVALLALALAAMFFTLPMSIFILPALGVLAALWGTINNPRGNSLACTFIHGI